jgi:hypothetical protein
VPLPLLLLLLLPLPLLPPGFRFMLGCSCSWSRRLHAVLSVGMFVLLACVYCAECSHEAKMLAGRAYDGEFCVPLPLLRLLPLLLLLLPGCRLMLGCSCSWSRRPTSGSLQATAAER